MLSKVTQRFPVLTAAAIYSAAVALAFLPFFRGQFLVNAMSDARTGYPGRELAAAYYHANGGILEWMPYTFGGMPFLANTGNGDTFYPTFLLRLLLSPDAGVSLGFMIHLVLAGVFMFLFLRALKFDWGSAFTGGAAYLMSGQIVSLVSPGHDGKLFVSALLPLALYFLVKGVDDGLLAELRRVRRHGGLLAAHPARAADLLPADGGGVLLVLPGVPERRTRGRRLLAGDGGVLRGRARAGLRLRLHPADALLRVHQVLPPRRRREQQHRIRVWHRLVHAARGSCSARSGPPSWATSATTGAATRSSSTATTSAWRRSSWPASASASRGSAGWPGSSCSWLSTACSSPSAGTPRSTGFRTPSCRGSARRGCRR